MYIRSITGSVWRSEDKKINCASGISMNDFFMKFLEKLEYSINKFRVHIFSSWSTYLVYKVVFLPTCWIRFFIVIYRFTAYDNNKNIMIICCFLSLKSAVLTRDVWEYLDYSKLWLLNIMNFDIYFAHLNRISLIRNKSAGKTGRWASVAIMFKLII